MQIKLKNLRLQNFKGIRHFETDFDDVTNIYGRNGLGKTTIFDAFLWLLFGKDSSNRSTFEIKTLDENNEPYRKLAHEVTATLLVNGDEVVLKRLYEEKWVKKTGSKEQTFSGHVTSYSWNEVPLNEKDYNAKIAGIINENQFTLLTNLAYFNTVMKWEQRRTALLSIAGDIRDIDVAQQLNTGGEYDHLVNALIKNKSLDEYKKEVSGKIKKIKDETESLPARIDEARRGLPEEQDYTSLQNRITSLTGQLEAVETDLLDKTKINEVRQTSISNWMRRQNELRQQIIQLENNARNTVKDNAQARIDNIHNIRRKLNSITEEKNGLLADYNAKKRAIEILNVELSDLKNEKDRVSKQWEKANAETFIADENACVCPACKRALDNAAAKMEDLQKSFNTNKENNIKAITEKGMRLKADIEAKEGQISLANTELENLKAKGLAKGDEIAAAEKELSAYQEENTRLSADESKEVADTIANDFDIIKAKQAIADIDVELKRPADNVDNSELLSKKRHLAAEITELNKLISSKDQREKVLNRIAELESSEEKSAQELADLENIQFSLLQFDKKKMDILEERINGRFRLVKFKLFDRTIDGSEKPTCVTLVNGVPYPDANTASKINASLDIINVFSEYYQVQAPVFIDNRESVVDIIHTDSQIVNLVVSAADNKLRVEAQSHQEVFA
jgi:exonuclease SbcC